MPSSRIRTLAALSCSAALAAAEAATAPAASAQALRPTCSAGGTVAALPFTASPRGPVSPVQDSMQITATRNDVFAGIAYRSASRDFRLLTRAPGQRPTVLRKVHYFFTHATPNAVTAMGFTPQINLVVAVQNPYHKPGRIAFGTYKDLYYSGRTAHYLAAGRSRISYMPTAVAATGRIAGWAATVSPTRPHYFVVTWSGVTARPVAPADLGSLHPSVQMTGRSAIALARHQRLHRRARPRRLDARVERRLERRLGRHLARRGDQGLLLDGSHERRVPLGRVGRDGVHGVEAGCPADDGDVRHLLERHRGTAGSDPDAAGTRTRPALLPLFTPRSTGTRHGEPSGSVFVDTTEQCFVWTLISPAKPERHTTKWHKSQKLGIKFL